MSGSLRFRGAPKPELILTTGAMREADRRTIAAGTSGVVLMERAGAAVALAVSRHLGRSGRILVACGPGNNGGDGFVAARLLAARGHSVDAVILGSKDRLTGDAARAARDWTGPIGRPEETDPSRYDLIIDALFGAGLSRDVDGVARALVERINAARRPVVAVDIPSGVDGNTGQVRGAAVVATETVTFAARKPGHLLLPGRMLAGPLTVADIGIPRETLDAVAEPLFANAPPLWADSVPRPPVDGHKYNRGHTLVLSGGAARTGAARLAARGALRLGSGLVTVAAPPEAVGIAAAQLTAVMVRGCDGAEGLAAILQDRRFNALVVGPALGVHAGTRAMIAAAVEAGRALVLDADALTALEGFASNLDGALSGAPTVITPHDGEFARLFGDVPAVMGAPSKIERARRAARHLGCVCVLKGPDTVIAAPDGRAAVNENGTSDLATAGSGDVLSGFVAGLLAQAVPAFESAAMAVWIHAEAGAALGPGLIAEDLPEAASGVLGRLTAHR